MRLACAVGTFVDPDARILSVTVFLAFYTPNRNTEVLSDSDQVVNDTNSPVRSLLATSGFAHATFKVAVDWLGDLLSGHLHHDAATMEFGGRSFSLSILRRFSLRLGLKGSLHGTNRKITA